MHISLVAETFARIGPVPITNSMVMAWLAMLVLILFAYLGTRNMQLVPTGWQNALEYVLSGLLGVVENTAGHYGRAAFPLIATLFLFIITANYMGQLPGVGTILIRNPEVHEAQGEGRATRPLVATAAATTVEAAQPAAPPAAAETARTKGKKEKETPAMIPLLRAANADLNMTLAMGLTAFLFIHFSGIRVHGIGGYWKELSTPLFLTPVKIMIESFVPVSLSMRLFGNIFGGEMLLTVMGWPLIAIPFMLIELLFGFIQALIFSMLTLIFTSLSTYLPPGHGGHGGGGGPGAAHSAHRSGE